MVYASSPWKQDLLRWKRSFQKYNTVERFKNDHEATYTVLEKAIFYSAFIIRKLIDCHGKLSDEADHYALKIQKVAPRKKVDELHRWLNEETHDWGNPQKVTVKGKDICNWLIHSYIFCLAFGKNEIIDGFFVTSDFDRNKTLYYISICDWMAYISFIGKDKIAAVNLYYDAKINDYIYIRKTRGS